MPVVREGGKLFRIHAVSRFRGIGSLFLSGRGAVSRISDCQGIGSFEPIGTLRKVKSLSKAKIAGKAKTLATNMMVLFAASLVTGCVFSSNDSFSSSPSYTSEVDRELATELVSAAVALDAAPWPKPDSVSIQELFSGAGPQRISVDEAMSLYAMNLQDGANAWLRLEEDVAGVINAAERVALAADAVTASSVVSERELSIVEGAIQTLGENKMIVLGASAELADAIGRADGNQMKKIKTDFNRAIANLKISADQIATQLDVIRKAKFDTPENVLPNFGVAGG